jgi:hypothetical protein
MDETLSRQLATLFNFATLIVASAAFCDSWACFEEAGSGGP